ncbi:MAG: hypothetical protein HF312_02650 [Ignavibacteria bacterium]|jgi:hypothetical protein|nr:hypothetical protein [Ignavibacteria bacterium]MCU7519085.1 hypothetical protein [Ignavibacteria bacterium]
MATFHILPGQTLIDDSWLNRMNDFERTETIKQCEFKEKHFGQVSYGKFIKKPEHFYPHILPDGYEDKVYYGKYEEIENYFKTNNIEFHSESLNLRSSQVCCINFLFPLFLDHNLATKSLSNLSQSHKNIFTNIKNVSRVEFEYTGDNNEYKILGESDNGKRGQNRTSIDVAIFWTDDAKNHLTLIEWKYTEKNFGGCRACADAKKKGNYACLKVDVLSNPSNNCLLVGNPPLRNRTYWQIMDKAGIDLNKLVSDNGCPFQGPFYQLMRQYLLAYAIKQSNPTLEIDLISIGFKNNISLHKVPDHLLELQQIVGKKTDIINLWNNCLSNVAPLQHIYVEDLTKAIEQTKAFDDDWRKYIAARYSL